MYQQVSKPSVSSQLEAAPFLGRGKKPETLQFVKIAANLLGGENPANPSTKSGSSAANSDLCSDTATEELLANQVIQRTQEAILIADLYRERLPHTQQVSCGLSLITSQSAQRTALRNQTALTSALSLASMGTASVGVHFTFRRGEPPD